MNNSISLSTGKLISMIIPVYNEEANAPLIYRKLVKVLDGLKENYDYEIIFVNDGSEDKSGQIIEDLAEIDKKVKYIEFSRNFGKEIATSAGIHFARGDVAIMIDADLQHPVELIPKFLKKWQEGADIVVGIRENNKGEGLFKRIGSSLFYKIMNIIVETHIISRATDYRLINKKVIQEFDCFTERSRITRGLLDWLGFKRDFIYFNAKKRRSGKARYNHSKLTKLALSTFITHSLFPLKLAGYLGVIITFFSGCLGLFIFIEKYLLDDPLQLNFTGTAALAVLIIFLVGIILCCLGFIALYIANIHNEVTNRPLYIIKKKKNFKEKGQK